jgi:hypothetical protein
MSPDVCASASATIINLKCTVTVVYTAHGLHRAVMAVQWLSKGGPLANLAGPGLLGILSPSGLFVSLALKLGQTLLRLRKSEYYCTRINHGFQTFCASLIIASSGKRSALLCLYLQNASLRLLGYCH